MADDGAAADAAETERTIGETENRAARRGNG